MAAKQEKNFAQNVNLMHDAIADATDEGPKKRAPRREYNEAERQAYAEELRTTGRKGCKMPRINMAFKPQIYEFIQTMSRVSGLSLTAFVNLVMEQYMEEHKNQYEQAISFRNNL